MRRTLMLDEDDLIMVIKDDVVKQIDENRGELNRTEFVNHLIHCQLQDCYSNSNYVAKDEFRQYTNQITELLHNFLQFFVSYGMSMGRENPATNLQALNLKLEQFQGTDGKTGSP